MTTNKISEMLTCAQTIYENSPLPGHPCFTQAQIDHLINTVHFRTKGGELGALNYYPEYCVVEVLNPRDRSLSYIDFVDKDKLVRWLENNLC
jgi:hypothetical protein